MRTFAATVVGEEGDFPSAGVTDEFFNRLQVGCFDRASSAARPASLSSDVRVEPVALFDEARYEVASFL